MTAIEASYFPQLLRLHRLKVATGISVLFPATNLFGRLLALAYAAHLGDVVLSLGFFVGVATRAVFLVQVLLYRESLPRSLSAWSRA